ncbi:hypothetical protein JCM13664_21830 [Methylothermus subterraneus]
MSGRIAVPVRQGTEIEGLPKLPAGLFQKRALMASRTPPLTPQTVVVGAPALALWLQ